MPQCPHCQTPYEEGQRYCKMCGSFLLHPEQGDTFCPQCGVRVSPRQEFCHECDAPLPGAKTARQALELEPEAQAPLPEALEPSPAPPPPTGIPSWLIALLAGSGIVIIVLLILLFTRGTSMPPAPSPAPKVEVPAPGAPAAPASLKEQLQNVLSTLREAQLHQDISQFMSVYSPTFPELADKRANTLKSWEHYDFTNLVFTIDKIQPFEPDNAIAWVTWYLDTKNRRTQELSTSTQTYKVRFAKEQGKWRIRSLEEVEP
jgi:uncharacterized Zn finger protein (UPF0148 family)